MTVAIKNLNGKWSHHISQVSLLPATEKRQDDLMHAPEEWTALAPIKERPSFKFGPLDHPSMDLMLLQVKADFSLLTPNGNCSLNRAACCAGGGRVTPMSSSRCCWWISSFST